MWFEGSLLPTGVVDATESEDAVVTDTDEDENEIWSESSDEE